MVQATTPTFILTLPDTVDLSEAESVCFSLKQGITSLNKTGDSVVVDGFVVSVYLTQEETLPFRKGTAQLQLNWTYSDGSRAASNIKSIDVMDNLLHEVVE